MMFGIVKMNFVSKSTCFCFVIPETESCCMRSIMYDVMTKHLQDHAYIDMQIMDNAFIRKCLRVET